jgi:hypothetical protein
MFSFNQSSMIYLSNFTIRNNVIDIGQFSVIFSVYDKSFLRAVNIQFRNNTLTRIGSIFSVYGTNQFENLTLFGNSFLNPNTSNYLFNFQERVFINKLSVLDNTFIYSEFMVLKRAEFAGNNIHFVDNRFVQSNQGFNPLFYSFSGNNDNRLVNTTFYMNKVRKNLFWFRFEDQNGVSIKRFLSIQNTFISNASKPMGVIGLYNCEINEIGIFLLNNTFLSRNSSSMLFTFSGKKQTRTKFNQSITLKNNTILNSTILYLENLNST